MDLPNTDIFDPTVCVRRWEQYATQQEINVYLTKQIDLNRRILKETIDTQKKINESSATELADHEKRIASLESGLAALEKAQTDLNATFQALQTDNNNFKSNVDLLLNQYQSTINLLQANVDKISLSNEQLWNEVNKLKSQFDPDKLDAAIAGYESVLADAKKYADAINTDLQGKIDALTKTVSENKTELESAIKAETTTRQNEIANFEQEVRSALNQQTADINAFMTSVNKTNAAQRQWLETELARVDKRIDNLNNKVEQYQEANANTHTDLKNQIAAAKKDAADNLAAKSQELQTNIDALSEVVTSNYNDLSAEIKKQRNEVDSKISSEVEKLQNEIETLQTSDLKQWDTINQILEAQNKINTRMGELDAYITEQIGLVKSSLGLVEKRVDQLETKQAVTVENFKAVEARSKPQYAFVYTVGTAKDDSHEVGFATLNVQATSNQVNFNLTFESGALLMATRGGSFNQVNSGANMSAIASTNAPNVPNYFEGVFYNDTQTVPFEIHVVYNPFTKEVAFNFEYAEKDLPKIDVS